MQPVVKGMIQVDDPTDRIVRTTHRQCLGVIEDAPMSAFLRDTSVISISGRVASPGIKTRWVGRLALG
ncbi:MAG TPA: hypothetical protein VER11_23120 [Polyangiaceae bacterium]|nr:hypothetical protein [Polyangiaceae bacterium]